MNDYSLFENTYQKLFRWIKHNNYCGYDPYDGMNNEYFKKKMRNNRICFYWIQFHKMWPYNLRPFLGIQKTVSNKGTGLIVQALLKSKIENSNSEIKKLISHLLNTSLKDKYGMYFWSPHNFDLCASTFPGSIQCFTHDTPAIVGTEECATAFLEYYKKFGKFKEVIIDVKDFIMKEFIQNNSIVYMKYSFITPSSILVYNASSIGFSYLVRVNKIIQDSTISKLAKKYFDFLVSQQHKNGAWDYAINLKTGKRTKLTDYHQGFILNSLYDFKKYTEQSEEKHFKSLLKGAKFYREEQFFNDGRCKYRYPGTWPVDIHNQAQGIITFSKLSEIESEYLEFAKTIAKWTIENMQDEAGYFYYQKWPFFTNKIPYMRWGQSWMMLALATLLEAMKNE